MEELRGVLRCCRCWRDGVTPPEPLSFTLSLSWLLTVFAGVTMPKPEPESHPTTVGREKVEMKETGGGCREISAVAAGDAACTAGLVSAPPSWLVFQRREEKPCRIVLSLSLSSGRERVDSFPPWLLPGVPSAGHGAGWPGSLWDGHQREKTSGFDLTHISLLGMV